MKNHIILFTAVTISMLFIFTACSKQNASSEKDAGLKSEIEDQKADILLKGDGKYKKVITKPLVKPDDCKFIAEGTIEFYLDDKLAATVDFGNGECDNIATKTIGDKVVEFKLLKEGKDWKYKKVIVEPLVKKDDCEYIVSGIIEFYLKEKLVATVDYGDGECDEWATKTWDGGSKEFSLAKD